MDNENRKIIFKEAEENDVDLILDMKLDIILNNKQTLNMNKNELEKAVLETEEQIRENLYNYKLIVNKLNVIGFVSIVDVSEEILIDSIYIMSNYRNNGIGTYILKEIIRTNFKPINICTSKENNKLINICQNIGFSMEEQENKLYMKYQNDKEENKQIKAELLCKEVSKLCEKYKVKYFFYTENKSVSNTSDKNISEQIKQIIKKNL